MYLQFKKLFKVQGKQNKSTKAQQENNKEKLMRFGTEKYWINLIIQNVGSLQISKKKKEKKKIH